MIRYSDIEAQILVYRSRGIGSAFVEALQDLIKVVPTEIRVQELTGDDKYKLFHIMLNNKEKVTHEVEIELKELFMNETSCKLIHALFDVDLLDRVRFEKISSLDDDSCDLIRKGISILKNSGLMRDDNIGRLFWLNEEDLKKVVFSLYYLQSKKYLSLLTQEDFDWACDHPAHVDVATNVMERLRRYAFYSFGRALADKKNLTALKNYSGEVEHLKSLVRLFALFNRTHIKISQELFDFSLSFARYAEVVESIFSKIELIDVNTYRKLILIGDELTFLNKILERYSFEPKTAYVIFKLLLQVKSDMYRNIATIVSRIENSYRHAENKIKLITLLCAVPESHPALSRLITIFNSNRNLLGISDQYIPDLIKDRAIYLDERFLSALEKANADGSLNPSRLSILVGLFSANGYCSTVSESVDALLSKLTEFDFAAEAAPTAPVLSVAPRPIQVLSRAITLNMSKFSDDMRRYLTEISHQKKPFVVPKNASDDCCCTIGGTAMNISVMLGEYAYELENLLKIREEARGLRRNPTSRDMFKVIEIRPARALRAKIQATALAEAASANVSAVVATTFATSRSIPVERRVERDSRKLVRLP